MTVHAILISGASSGVGAALACVHAAPGARLHLWGRDEARLETVARKCRARGAEATTAAFDLTDFSALKTRLIAADEAAPIALAYLNAGLGGSLEKDRAGQAPEAVERMAGVNFTAPIIAANMLAERMAARKSGRIVLVGSVAGEIALPMAPSYSATKAGLKFFATALRARLARFGIGVTLVAPGFIDTPMSQDLKEPRPFLISAERAAHIIVNKVARGRSEIVLPWQFAAILAVARAIPKSWLAALLARFA